MPRLEREGIGLHYEEAGSGPALLLVHEMAGDAAAWEPQMRAFARRYRCIAYCARGYPPSDVPEDGAAYSQDEAAEDVRRVMDGLDISRAHLVGLSMGSFAALHFALRHPSRLESLVLAGCGHGSDPARVDRFRADALALAGRAEGEGMEAVASLYARNASRVQFESKDPRGFAQWRERLAAHSAAGTARTLRGVQAGRPSLMDLGPSIESLRVPTLLVAGDEDDPALDVSLWLKRTLPAAGLAVLPRTGHTVNLEEPDAFNAVLRDFLWRVEGGAWGERDARSRAGSTMFPDDEAPVPGG